MSPNIMKKRESRRPAWSGPPASRRGSDRRTPTLSTGPATTRPASRGATTRPARGGRGGRGGAAGVRSSKPGRSARAPRGAPPAAEFGGDPGGEQAGERQAGHQRGDVPDQADADDGARPLDERPAEVRLHRQERPDPDVDEGHQRQPSRSIQDSSATNAPASDLRPPETGGSGRGDEGGQAAEVGERVETPVGPAQASGEARLRASARRSSHGSALLDRVRGASGSPVGGVGRHFKDSAEIRPDRLSRAFHQARHRATALARSASPPQGMKPNDRPVSLCSSSIGGEPDDGVPVFQPVDQGRDDPPLGELVAQADRAGPDDRGGVGDLPEAFRGDPAAGRRGPRAVGDPSPAVNVMASLVLRTTGVNGSARPGETASTRCGAGGRWRNPARGSRPIGRADRGFSS